MNDNRDKVAASWPFAEAARIEAASGPVIFESGFGPSGRPHIGTFAEVARTIMVQNAFRELHPDADTKLYAFCDDMDGLRKVPGNMPEPEMLRENLGRPLSRIPDPFGTDASFSAHMERELEEFLGRFGFKFELKSSTVEYATGVFNPGLKKVLEHYDQVRAVVIPTLGEENRERWSPFIPICEKCGRLYTTSVTGTDPATGTLTYECTAAHGEGQNQVAGCGHHGQTSVFDGRVKVGWKVDWALRWFTYNIRYEMYGKDLIDSARLSGKITRILGGTPPAGMVYELFLDEAGKKISKSVGEGLTVDSWMTYAPIESLLFYLFQNPKKQRRLYFDVIPKSMDDYLDELRRFPALDESAKLDSVAWHLGRIGRPAPAWTGRIDFTLALNLISALGAGDRGLLLDYLRRYDPEVENNLPIVTEMVERAAHYFRDFIEPNKKYRPATEDEKKWFAAIAARVEAGATEDENELQGIVFDAAKDAGADAKAVFKAIYEVLLGQERGPRFGTFAKLLGRERTLELLRRAL